jgi:hypothetical protein
MGESAARKGAAAGTANASNVRHRTVTIPLVTRWIVPWNRFVQYSSEQANACGSGPSPANANTKAGLNCEGVVDIDGFSLLAANYRLSGDPAP